MEPPPVFVVGVPRSGTTLLAALLASHSRLACGPETVFFPAWRATDRRAILGDPHWPARAVAFLTSLPAVGGARVHETFGIGPDELHEFLTGQPRRAESLLAALVQTHARRAGKPRWVEKTPAHLIHVREIRRLFPRAPILRIVRDPRDVALSLQAMPWGAPSLLANAYRWQTMDRASAAFFAADGNSHTVLYERLVTRPEEELRRVCAWIGEEFEPGMLGGRRSLGSLAVPGEWWKDRAAAALDPGRCLAWKRALPREDRAALELICQEGLDRYGYERTAQATTTHAVYALDAWTVAACEGLLRRAAAGGTRFLPLRYEGIAADPAPARWPGPLVFLGDSVPVRRPADRWRYLGRLARTLLLRQLHGRTNLRAAEAPPAPRKADAVVRLARALLAAGCLTRRLTAF